MVLLLLLVSGLLVFLPVENRVCDSARMVPLEDWFRSRVPDSVFSAGGGRGSVEAWYTTALDLEEVLSYQVLLTLLIGVFWIVLACLAGSVTPLLSTMLMSGYVFSWHLALGSLGLVMGSIPQGCRLSMMFIVALYLPWCRYFADQEGVEPQLHADNLKCVSGDPGLLLRAARFTTGYVRLVGQEPAHSK